MNISINPEIEDIMKTKDLLFSGENQISEINDTDWYEGNVLQVKSECRDCEENIVVMNHIHYEGKVEYIPGCVEYKWSKKGGSIQTYDSLITIDHDNSIRDFVFYP